MKSRDDRLKELLASVEKMAGGDVEHRVEISSAHDELDALGFAFNVMVGELSYKAKQVVHAKEEAERRNAELAAAQAGLLARDRLATLGQLAGGVAHQIRNPLAVILNATSLLEHSLLSEQHPDVGRAIGIIREEVRHANIIVSALLDYARLRQPARQRVCLAELINRVLGDGRIPATVRVHRNVGEHAAVHVDGDQLHDAILNLVLNAVEAMPSGGDLTIELTQREEWMVIAVSDTGPGIPDALAARLFEPLHSTKPLGVGLGLVTARTFVEGHGGRIDAVPVDRGARFEIRLPLETNTITTSA